MKKLIIAVSLLCYSSIVYSQSQEEVNFNWVNNANQSSTTVSTSCGLDYTITLTTTGAPHYFDNSSDPGALTPVNSQNTVRSIHVDLDFGSQIVEDLQLLVYDLDMASTGEVELISNISPSAHAIAGHSPYALQGRGPIVATGFDGTGGITQVGPTNNMVNCDGWIVWNNPTSSVSFDIQRPGKGYKVGLMLMRFTCPSICTCENSSSLNGVLNHHIVEANGQKSISLKLDSDGDEVRKLNISLTNYDILTFNECVSLNKNKVASYGNIINLPKINNVSPTYTGNSSGYSTEISYLFPQPIVLDYNINMLLQFPEALSLACCSNEMSYCMKTEMIDEDCNYCENIFCVTDPTAIGDVGLKPLDLKSNSIASVTINKKAADSNGLSKSDFVSSQIEVYPNPNANDNINFANKSEETIKGIKILSTDSKEVFNNDNISTSSVSIKNLESGVYIIQFEFESGLKTTKQFIKQ
jgi:hypothetical protein